MDMSKLMRLIPKMHKIESELRLAEVIGQSSCGLVKAVFCGDGKMKALHVDDSLTDVSTIEALSVTAINEAKKKAGLHLVDQCISAMGQK